MEFDEQQIFDFVSKNLINQGVQSSSGPNGYTDLCSLRDEQGNKCALGWLIPDNEYKKKMESISGEVERFLAKYLPHLKEHAQLIGALQAVHDGTGIVDLDDRSLLLYKCRSIGEYGVPDFDIEGLTERLNVVAEAFNLRKI